MQHVPLDFLLVPMIVGYFLLGFEKKISGYFYISSKNTQFNVFVCIRNVYKHTIKQFLAIFKTISRNFLVIPRNFFVYIYIYVRTPFACGVSLSKPLQYPYS